MGDNRVRYLFCAIKQILTGKLQQCQVKGWNLQYYDKTIGAGIEVVVQIQYRLVDSVMFAIILVQFNNKLTRTHHIIHQLINNFKHITDYQIEIIVRQHAVASTSIYCKGVGCVQI